MCVRQGPFLHAVPFLRARYVAYGSRAPSGDARAKKPPPRRPDDGQTGFRRWGLDPLALTVPHAWFWHYYAVSVLLSLFWLPQLLAGGSAVRWLAGDAASWPQPAPAREQVLLAWGLVSAQGLRRLGEYAFVLRPSAAPMPFLVHIVGIAYYTFLSVGVWIDGAGA